MARTKGGMLAQAQVQQQAQQLEEVQTQKKSISALFNDMIDQEGVRGRINELLKDRAPQFTASLVSLVSASPQMKQVFAQAPMTIIQSALKAASYDLPTDPALGFAYVLPFSVWNKETRTATMQAQFIMGYRGLLQLAMRTGAYKRINVIDIRDGEIVSYNRLTEDIEFSFIEDTKERSAKPIIGYVGYYRLVNGMEKTIFKTIDEIKAHELAHRKGNYQNPIWADTTENAENFKAMCKKTVLRELIGKWGMMSVDYRNASPEVVELATNAMQGRIDDEDDNANTLDIDVVEQAFEEELAGDKTNG